MKPLLCFALCLAGWAVALGQDVPPGYKRSSIPESKRIAAYKEIVRLVRERAKDDKSVRSLAPVVEQHTFCCEPISAPKGHYSVRVITAPVKRQGVDVGIMPLYPEDGELDPELKDLFSSPRYAVTYETDFGVLQIRMDLKKNKEWQERLVRYLQAAFKEKNKHPKPKSGVKVLRKKKGS